MEVVLLVVAVLGIALIVVPRLQRRRNTPRVRRTPTVRRRRAAAVARPAAVATWTPDQSAGDDGWDDDLGWEGVAEPEPEAREAWERWRATESPLAAAPAAEPVEPPDLPSVERWRATADDDGWDDDLGWEGTDEPASGNGHVEPRIWTNGNGHVPEVPHGAQPVTSAFVGAATTDEVATRAGHSERVDQDIKPAAREWGATADGNGAAVVTAPRPKSRKIHPVLLVAIYAAAGIGLVVLASTALLGGSSSPEKSAPPATHTPAPQATATPSAEPAAAGTAADEPTDADEVTAAEAAAARKAYRRQRNAAQRSERRQAAKVASDARRKLRERRRHNGTGATVPTPPPTVNTTPPPSRNFTPPRPTCEFCIG